MLAVQADRPELCNSIGTFRQRALRRVLFSFRPSWPNLWRHLERKAIRGKPERESIKEDVELFG